MTNQDIHRTLWNGASGPMLTMAQYQKAFQAWVETTRGTPFDHSNYYFLPLAWQLSLRYNHHSGDPAMRLITADDMAMPLSQLISSFQARIKSIAEMDKTRLCTTLAAHHLDAEF